MLSSMESIGTSRDHYKKDVVFGVEVYYGQSGTGAMRLKLFFLVIFVYNFASFILHLHRFDFKKSKQTTSFPGCVCIKKKRPGLSRVCSGRSGSGLTYRVDRVSPGQLLGGFLLRPGPVPGPGRPAGPVRVSKLWLLFLKIFF